MTVQTSRRRLICLGGLGFLVAVALLSLSFPQLFFEPLPFWYRMADQALLVTGLLGSPNEQAWLALSVSLVICFKKLAAKPPIR
jgi:hypothetical protein